MVKSQNKKATYDDREGVPFVDPEEAWLWYARCRQARDDGARFVAGLGEVARPCAPDDIAIEVRRLYRRRVLRDSHLRVLLEFGDVGGAAVGHSDAHGRTRLWREALERLGDPLRAKGIVAPATGPS